MQLENSEEKRIREIVAKALGSKFKHDYRLEIECQEEDTYSESVLNFTLYVEGKYLRKIQDIVYTPEKSFENIMSQLGDYSYSFRIYRDISTDIKVVSVGDLVLIPNEYNNEDSVGLVVSKSIKENGEVVFGCSLILCEFSTDIGDGLAGVKLTKENYSGYHSGFAMKLTALEARGILIKNLENKHKEIISRIKTEYEINKHGLSMLLDELSIKGKKSKFKKVQVDQLKISEKFSTLSAYIAEERVRFPK